MTSQQQHPAMTTRLRIRWIIAVALVLLGVLATRLVWVQGVDAAGFADEAMNERLRSVPLPAERGSILDKNGNVLAESVSRYNLVADQRLNEDYRVWDEESRSYQEYDIDDRIDELATILDMDPDDLRALMMGDSPYQIITRGVTPEVRDEALDLDIPGLIAEPVAERSYPNGAVAGNILGFLGQEGHGLEGLEQSQEASLEGTPGERTFEIAANGVRIPHATFEETEPVDGQDLRLTIDQDVSWYAQEAIAEKVDEYNAEWGNIVVQEVKTGNILALADSTTVDPSDPSKTDSLFWRPTSVTQAYEPGSTGKVSIFAAALNEGGVGPTTPHTVPNKQEFDHEVINDSMPHDTYDMTTAGIFARSYNTGTVQVAETLSKEQRYDYMKKFGIGDPIDLGLPYSSSGQFANWQDWDRRQQFTTTFGQGYSVTALHTAQIFQTVANGGVRKNPRLIDTYVDPDGTEHAYDAGEDQRVISEETADEMLKLMEGVVENGSGGASKIPGYRVGGKTGTGQVAGESGGYDSHVTTYAMVAPLEDPEYVVSVTVYRPEGNWKSWQVTDTAADVMSYVLNKNSVPHSTTDSQAYDVFVDDPQKRPW